MAVAFYTLTVDPYAISGAAPGSDVAVKIRTNTGGAIIDAAADKIFLGSHRVNTKTAVTISLPATNGATNPTNFQYAVELEYADPVTREREKWDSGWFSFTAAANLADIVAEQYVPPTWQSAFTASMEAIRDKSAANLADQVNISGISTSDAVVEALIKNTGGAGPLTSAALTASTKDIAIGRVTPTKHAPALGLYFPEAEGAVGDGVADDTAAVVAAFAAATATKKVGAAATIFEPGGTVHLQGTYKLTTLAGPIVATCNISGEYSALVVPDAYADVVLLLGHDTSGSILHNAHVKVPSITKASSASIVAGSVAVKIQNVWNSELAFRRTAYFETGLWFTGLGNGTVYNRLHIGWISYCKVSMRLKPLTSGWVNANKFLTGGIQQSPGSFGGGLRRPGWKHLEIDGAGINTVQGNEFSISFEGDVSESTITLADAIDNKFIGTYHEVGTLATATTVSGDTLTTTAHGLTVGDQVMLNATSAPGGMVPGARYFVVTVPTADTFKVSRKKAGTAITFTSAGTGVTFLRPQRITIDSTLRCHDNVWFAPSGWPGFLEFVDANLAGYNNTVIKPGRYVVDALDTTDSPVYRGRNFNGTAGAKRPIFAAYPSGTNPELDPNGWSVAVSDMGVIFSSGGTEVGRLYWNPNTGAGTWSAVGGTAYDIATCVRTTTVVTLATGTTYTANTRTSGTKTLTGAALGDYVDWADVIGGAIPRGLVISARVSSANTVTYDIDNNTGSDITLAADIGLYFKATKRLV